MTVLLTTLRTLLSYWRRQPFQLAAMLVGLMIATALWSGVQALNAQAKQSYARAAATLGANSIPVLVPEAGSSLPQQAFVDLRRAGWQVSPVVEGRVRINGQRIRLLGVEPLSAPAQAGVAAATGGADGGFERLGQFMRPPHLAVIAPDTAADLGLAEGDTPALGGGGILPEIAFAEALGPGVIMVDIGAAQRILNRQGMISRLLLDPEAPDPQTPLPPGINRIAPQENSDLERLTDSFHLNLTAFGLLSFLVGLFIVHSAIGLSFEQRRGTCRTLRACGVSAGTLTVALLIEILSFALLASIAGVAIGYLVAAALLPDVAASLDGLYGAEVAGTLSLSPVWWMAGVAMGMGGALVAGALALYRAYTMPVLATAQRYAWRAAQSRALLWQGGGAILLLAVAGLAARFGEGLVGGFTMLGALMTGAALLLPVVLVAVLSLGERLSDAPMVRWFWADARQQSGGLSLALMALLLALGANIGVGTMVGSFRGAFLDWLDQRLVSELYVSGKTAEQTAEMRGWLEAQEPVEITLPIWRARTKIDGVPSDIIGFIDHRTYRENWTMLAGRAPWDAVARGEAVLISEQLARRANLSLGDALVLEAETGPLTRPVAGIFADYGNPLGQVQMNTALFDAAWPGGERLSLGVRMAPEAVPALRAALTERFHLDESQAIDNAALKAFSRGVFEQTFAVTAALNVLTLGVAAVALFTSLLTLSSMRLPQIAPLWAIGVTRRRLAQIDLGKTVALAAITALAAIPLGLAVAWCLLAVVNVQAFGWRLPMELFPLDWLRLGGLALLAAALAAALPMLRLRRTPPAQLIKVFSDER